MPTITITATLTYDPNAHETHEERQWFLNTIIRNPHNIIYSPTLSQNIATIAVTTISTP
jgi:hypothetical protein